jgi:hypothetical protein
VPTGALIAPSGRAAEALSEDEYKYIRTCLDIIRNRSKDANGFLTLERRMLEMIVRGTLVGHGLKQNALAEELVNHLQETDQADNVSGYFHDGTDLHVVESEEEASAVLAFMQVLHRGGWFAEFIADHCRALDGSAGAYPTPLEIMQSLVSALDSFNRDVRAAREVVALYPHLFKAETKAAPPSMQPAETARAAVGSVVAGGRLRQAQVE